METNNDNTTIKENVILPAGGDANIIIENKNDQNKNDIKDNKNDIIDKNKDNNVDNNKDIKIQNKDQDIQVPIEIDGVDYSLDKDGNAINKDGSIFMTKNKIDENLNKSNNDDNNIISQVEKINNIIIIDENNNPIKYDSTPEGIAKRELDIITHSKTVGEQEGIQNFLQSNPDLNSMYQYKQIHGTLEGYGKNIDYTTITIDKSNKDQLKQFIVDEQLSKGGNIETAKQFAEFAEKNNTLEKLGTVAFDNLKNTQLNIIQTKQKEFEEYSNRTYGIKFDNNNNIIDLKVPGSYYDMIVTKGEFAGLKIPKDGIVIKNNDGTINKINNKQLFKLAAYADENGKSRLDNIIENYLYSKAENKLVIGLYILKGGDLSELANSAVSKNQINKIKISTANNKNINRTINNQSSDSKVVLPVH